MSATAPPSSKPTGMVRARHPQMMVSLAAERVPILAEQVRASLPAATHAVLDDAAPSSWVPIEHDIRTVEAVRKAVGQATYDAVLQERARREMGSPLFKSFVGTALRLFGSTGSTVVKQLGNGWPQLFQDVGSYEVLSIEGETATSVLRALPRACTASATWVEGVAVAIEPLFELVEATASVTSTLDRQDLFLSFSWRRGLRRTAVPPSR